MKKIFLKTRFNNIINSTLLFLHFILINLIGFTKILHSVPLLLLFVLLTVLILGITVMHYELRISENGSMQYNLVFLGIRKKIQEFSNNNIRSLDIKQLANKYYGIFLSLQNEEILLNSKETLDKAEEYKRTIEKDFIRNNLLV